jgi:hypothetical protein
MREYRQKNKIKLRKQKREWSRRTYLIQKDKIKARNDKWTKKNPDKVRAKYKRYYNKVRNDPIKWKKMKQKCREAKARRRTRKLKNGGSFTHQDIENLYKKQCGKCFYCKSKLCEYHIEHKIPISRGGSSDPENIVLSCVKCNLYKNTKTHTEFMSYNGYY